MSVDFRTFAFQIKHPKCTVTISAQYRANASRFEHSLSLDFDGSYYGQRPHLSEASARQLAAELEVLTLAKPFEPSAELVAMILKDVDDHLRVHVLVPLEMRAWHEDDPSKFELSWSSSCTGAGYHVKYLGEFFEVCWDRYTNSDSQWHDVKFHLSLTQADMREPRVWVPPYELQQEIGQWLSTAGEDLSNIPPKIEAALRAAAVAMLDQPVGGVAT